MSAPKTSRASTLTWGQTWFKRASSLGIVSQTVVSVYASRRVPASPRAAAWTRRAARSAAVRTRRQSARNTCPSVVSSTRRGVRRRSVTPRDRSSALICWLTACWAMCRSSAARVKLRRCATAAKVRNWRNSKPWPGITLATLPRCGPAATSYACYLTTSCACSPGCSGNSLFAVTTGGTSQVAAGATAAAADHHMRVDRVSSRPKRVLIVVANPATSTTLGWPVGFWGAELTHPYFELTQRGAEVTIASPDGGRVEMDALSDPRDESKWSADDLIMMWLVNSIDLVALLPE